MKRSPYMLVLSLPFILGAATPPFRPLPSPQAPAKHVVEINVIDRFLQDTGIRKRPTQSKRSRSRTQAGRAIPKPPALASVPVPMARPVDGAEPAELAAQASPAEEKQDATAETTTPTAKPAETDKPQAAATPPHPVDTAPEKETATTPKPGTDGAAASTQTSSAETATPPLVEQPATTSEPARQSEVPTPMSKPGADTATSGAEPDEAKEPATDRETTTRSDAKKDGVTDTEAAGQEAKPADQQSEEQKAESETPPPPLIKEDPRELQACLADLKAIGGTFEATDPIDDGNGCGIENPIDVKEALPGVDLGGATMRCKTALTMAHWLKQTAQPALDIAMPGRRIIGLSPGSTYQCRLRNSASTGKISEHARGNAYDVAAFRLDNGEKIEMKPRAEDSTLEGAFQRTVTAGACLHFTTVLSPGSDATHQDHLHLDILERDGGYRYCR